MYLLGGKITSYRFVLRRKFNPKINLRYALIVLGSKILEQINKHL